MFPRLTTALLICIFFSFLTPLRSERIVLKSGKILTGSIVDYDEDMFRVETEFGFALIRKDRVASISFEEFETPATSVQKDEQEPEKGSVGTAESKAVAQGDEKPATESTRPITAAIPEPVSVEPKPETANTPSPESIAAVESESAFTEPRKSASIAIEAVKDSQASIEADSLVPAPKPEPLVEETSIVAVSSPADAEPEKVEIAEAGPEAAASTMVQAEGETARDAEPEYLPQKVVAAAAEIPIAEERKAPPVPQGPVDPNDMVERVEGNLYINETFRFAMYKPPNWVLFEDVRKASATSIIAMGTVDERTLLFVEREFSGADPENHDGIEAKLRQTYREYKVLREEEVIVDGRAGVRRTFSGVLDGIDWHGMAVHVSDDYGEFGIIGLTSAETFQFKQAVFNKIVRTFRFTTP